MPVDYSKIYPELNGYLVKPLLVNPPMCDLMDLYNGNMTLKHLELMHQVMEIKQHMQPASNEGGN